MFPSNQKPLAEDFLPRMGDIVWCQVQRLGMMQAWVSIFAIENTALLQPFPGLIRKEDVRSEDIDRVDMSTSFLPGDVLKARILSLGDARNYFLTTAEDELGFYMGVYKSRSTDILAQPSLLLPFDHTHVRVVEHSEEEEGKKRQIFERKVARPMDA